jgi:hypothetical protein
MMMMMMMMKSTCMTQVSIPWNAHCALKKRGDKNSNDRTEKDKRRQHGAGTLFFACFSASSYYLVDKILCCFSRKSFTCFKDMGSVQEAGRQSKQAVELWEGAMPIRTCSADVVQHIQDQFDIRVNIIMNIMLCTFFHPM